MAICGLAVILTVGLWISKSNHFICVPNCTEVVNLVKFPQSFIRSVNKLLVYDHGRTHGHPENRMPPTPFYTLAKAFVFSSNFKLDVVLFSPQYLRMLPVYDQKFTGKSREVLTLRGSIAAQELRK